MGPTNQAAWLHGVGQPLVVGPAEMPTAGEGEIVIRNRALAINPVSNKIQDTGIVVKTWPAIIDLDIAGEVHEVGSGVNRFVPGDRVVAGVTGLLFSDNRSGAFQHYAVVQANTVVAKIPSNITFAEASVIPTALNTAIVALCAPPPKGFGLPSPTLSEPKNSGKTIVVWASSSSVGLQTMQVARAAGIQVIATASPHNFELCRSCGAKEVFDYRSPTVVEDVIKAVKSSGGRFAGLIDCVSIPELSVKPCSSIIEGLGAGYLGFLQPHIDPEVPEGVEVIKVIGMGEITHPFWKDYVTPGLETGKLKCLPEALVVGDGLDKLQEGLDVLKKGVSAKKVVVTLSE